MSSPWALHCLGFTAGMPALVSTTGAIEFTLGYRVPMKLHLLEPIQGQGQVVVHDIGPNRRLVSIVAEAPKYHRRQLVQRVTPIVPGLIAEGLKFSRRDDISTDRSYSILLGSAYHFTFDRAERLQLRNALSDVQRKYLSGEVSRLSLPHLSWPSLVTTDSVRRIKELEQRDEVVRQLQSAFRAEPWGYLWPWSKPPARSDAISLVMNHELTEEMAQSLRDIGETILRACGVKPVVAGFESGSEFSDALVWALVALRRGVDIEQATSAVCEALDRYGVVFDLRSLERSEGFNDLEHNKYDTQTNDQI